MGSLATSSKPIFLVTHPRACSTAFERAILTRDNDLVCVHEPFSDAYHWGPEKLSERYEDVERLRTEKGLQDYTFHAAFKVVRDSEASGKRVFVKDMAKCLMPLGQTNPCIVSSLQQQGAILNGSGGNPMPEHHHTPWEGVTSEIHVPNPTVIPQELLSGFHYAFLIRDPRLSIPSLYECTRPPKSYVTGWNGFLADDAGYKELRILFDYLVNIGQVGGRNTDNPVCIVDAEDLLSDPQQTMQRFCELVDIKFDRSMLRWDTEKDRKAAEDAFKNWAPFHDAVLKSTSLVTCSPKLHNPEVDYALWASKYGSEAAALIQKNVDDNMPHYLYLKQFAIRLSTAE